MRIKPKWRRLFLGLTLCAAAAASLSQAAGSDYLGIDDVIRLESASDFDFSSNGNWVVWVKTVPEGSKNARKQNIHLSRLDDDVTIQLTRGNDNDESPKFSPGGGRVAFLSARGSNKTKQIYILDLRGGEAKKMTSSPTGVNLYEWVDDGTIVFSAREDSTFRERALKKNKDDTIVAADQEHYAPVRLFKHDLDSGKTARLTENQGAVTEFAVSPSGEWIVTSENQDINYTYNRDNPPKQFLIGLRGGARREICTAPHVDPYDFKWDRAGDGFFCRRRVASDSTDTYVGISELFYYSLASDRLKRVELGWPRGLGRSYYVVGDGVVAALANGTTDRVVHAKTDDRSKYDVAVLDFEKPVRLAGADKRNNRIVYFSSDASSIPEVNTATVTNGRIDKKRKLFELNEALKKKTLSRTEIVRWAGARGDTVEGVLYYPPVFSDTTTYPLVALIHGGPAGVDPDFFTERWSNYPHVLASKGTFVFKVNYHGSGNYGLEWVESIKGHYYEYEVPDILSGIDHLITRGFVDETRLGIMGWSNGSILAVACCLETDRFKALCAGAGDVNWTSDYGNCDFGAGFDDAYFGGPPWENTQTYIDKSPLFRMQQMKTPTLIMFGSEDRSVPTEQGWQHFRALQTIGKVPVRFLLFPGTGHGLRKLSHQRRKMEEELAWFDEHLFGARREKNEAFDDQSLLAYELKKVRIAHVGYLVGREVDAAVVPEIVEFAGLRVSRFEITRAQFAAFDPNFTYPPGTDNHPVNGISAALAEAYCLWLGEKTGGSYRLPSVEEMDTLLAAARPNVSHENNLERWVGYRPTPDELAALRAKIEELEATRLLIEPVGSCRPVGEAGVYDLCGNVAEWVTDEQGKGVVKGLSAVSASDERGAYARPPLVYVGFRVLEK